MPRTAAQIRREFIDFFREKHAHTFVPSSPVVPHDDPTLMFTNAGMNQFKPIFLGQQAPDVDKWTGAIPGSPQRAVNSQKCIRAGGKHNDLDDVGHDTYHHTFFEMLGNWSFGDYFKKEAIEWAWELLTRIWGIDPERLHATFFQGDAAEGLEPDNEARDLWRKILPPERVHPGNKKDNFWEMGDTGPCGPCSEIHIDLTPDKDGGKLVNAGDARVMEIWNLVFIQFNRGNDGKLTPLPAKHVDTGMGFERVCSVIRGVESNRIGQVSNYDTDVFTPIFKAIQTVTRAGHYGGLLESGVESDRRKDEVMRDVTYRVIADHIRTLTFAITDGAMPDKEGRGYVLRRILRRAVRYGWQYLNVHDPFLSDLVPAVVESMGEAFPELRKNPQRVIDIIRDDEESFERTLERGIALFNEAADQAVRDNKGIIRGEDAFKLHDTFGFPIDLTEIMAHERGLNVDVKDYEQRMEDARVRARAGKLTVTPAHGRFVAFPIRILTEFKADKPTDDSYKYATNALDSMVESILIADHEGNLCELSYPTDLKANDNGAIVVDKTCFYAEQGGQVGDSGLISGASFRFDVTTTVRMQQSVLHIGTVVEGQIGPKKPVSLAVGPNRAATQQNHTATHVMNWALREVLDPEGTHLQQKGSLVDPEKTRFDFSHPKPLTPEEIERIEKLCERQIVDKLTVYDKNVPQAEALKIKGLRAVFGEKYPDVVRVVSVGVPVDDLLKNPANPDWKKYSIEFCGGTHVKSTADIQRFVITSEEAVAKGIRRIVAVTGAAASLAEKVGAGMLERAEGLRRVGCAHQGAGPAKGGESVNIIAKASESVGAAHPTTPTTSTPGSAAMSPEEFIAQVTELQNLAGTSVIPLRQRAKLRDLIAELQQLSKQQQKAQAADMAGVVNARVDELLPAVEKKNGTTIFVAELPDAPVEQLKGAADRIKQKCGSTAIFIGVRQGSSDSDAAGGKVGTAHPTAGGGKVMLLAAMTDDLIKKGLKAGDLVKAIAPIVEGGGGGPPTMAQAGGKNAAKLPEALEAAKVWIGGKLG